MWILHAGKLKFFGTRPNWAVSYIAYTKFHFPRPVLHSPGHIFTRIGKRASASFPAWYYAVCIQNNHCRIMLQGLCDGKSTLAQVMAWCRQATSHDLRQRWPSFIAFRKSQKAHQSRAGVKYVLSNTNTNTNTFFSEFQIQIQIQIHRQKSDQIQIQIQIQPIKYKYKYKYTLRPRQNWRHFTDDILKFILL